ncbi:serine/threonine-protein kinase PRP4 homolog [Crassostrea angulata]|uniref:serine/threonine-protein kinase PRP4 homolog n=1 Tax=Magallana angulata TaxID=2784310 RepID=UPI0022B0BF8D|nr:serine/threonine-protein kinase PRP4 homolog [Crassostrea angulata]
MDKKWVRAVWREDKKEMELAIPSVWVEGNRIRWPNTSNAKSALKECKKPADKWLSFDLIKIKFSSDDYRECEDYDETTAVESECDSEPVMKRKPKKKVMSDFIMDSAEDNSSIKMQKKLPVAAPVMPPKPPQKISSKKNQDQSSLQSSRSRSPSPSTRDEMETRRSRSITPSKSWASSNSRESSMNRSMSPRSPIRSTQRSRISTSRSPIRSTQRSRISTSRSPIRSTQRPRISTSRSPIRSTQRPRISTSRSPIRSTQRPRISTSRSPIRSTQRSRISTSRSPIRSTQRPRISTSRSPIRSTQRPRISTSRSPIRSTQRSRISRSRSPVHSLNSSRFSRSKSSNRHHNRSRHSMSQSSERSTLQRESPKRLNKGSEHSRSYDRPCSRLSVESTPTLPSLSKRKQNQSSTDSFPMTEERFQRRVLYLLVEIRDLLKSPVTTASNTEDVDLVTIDSEEGFEALDRRLENRDFKASFKFLLQKIGGTDGTDHMKKAMLRTMTNSYMAGLNMKGKRGKKAFGSSQLYLLIKETVLTSHTQYTESKFNEDLAKLLKYAPERVGGGGRRRRD